MYSTLRPQIADAAFVLGDILGKANHNLIPRASLLQNGRYIKPEPEEQHITPLAPSASWQTALDVKPVVKPEPTDATRPVRAD